MDVLTHLLNAISDALWGWVMIVLLMGAHLFFTIRLKFPQRYIFKAIKLSIAKDKVSTGDVSQFGALSTALATTIGTGNIVGVGTAVALGGPGAVFWCWLTGVLGIATKYAEGILAVKYRATSPEGKMQGGPMYALEKGLGWKIPAILFALFTTIASLGIGCAVQTNVIATMFQKSYGISPVLMGGIVTFLAALMIMGGVKGIAMVCKMLVPFIILFYLMGCAIILYANASFILPALKLIVKSAFDVSAISGGFAGTSIMLAMRYGIARGLFSNESGMGSAPIVAAAAQTKNPVRQALVSSTATFWDTVVICAMTGIVIVSSLLAYPELSFRDGEELVKEVFSKIPYVGTPILSISFLIFAISTIPGWSYYGERAVEYLAGKSVFRKIPKRRFIRFYRILYLLTAYGGAVISLNLVWTCADIFNALMAIPNLISLLFLSGVIVYETKKYLWSGEIDKESTNFLSED